ncbi:hypothetical protein E2320_004926, partial [Naja naja]
MWEGYRTPSLTHLTLSQFRDGFSLTGNIVIQSWASLDGKIWWIGAEKEIPFLKNCASHFRARKLWILGITE